MSDRRLLARSVRAGIPAFALAICAIGVLLACGSSAPATNAQDPNTASECVDAGNRCVPYDGYHSASGCEHLDPALKCGDGVSECCLDSPATCVCADGGAGCECPPCQEQLGDAAAGCNAPGERFFVCMPNAPTPVDAGTCNCGVHDPDRGTLCCCEAVAVGDE